MFQLPAVIAMSIAATRIYRNLADFVYGSTDMCFILRFIYLLRSLSSMIYRPLFSPQTFNSKITKTQGKPSAPTPVSRIEVTVDTRRERHSSTAQSIISVDGQLGYKSHRSSLDSDLERAMENQVPR
ncbi:hypothetical protein BGY98DRAFT_652496 [Russula aff. rugulosa BPL654]|nr:hypothetical protein BGY98DRAFT_652496 [Russula aff. rugulosa BPL654]